MSGSSDICWYHYCHHQGNVLPGIGPKLHNIAVSMKKSILLQKLFSVSVYLIFLIIIQFNYTLEQGKIYCFELDIFSILC